MKRSWMIRSLLIGCLWIVAASPVQAQMYSFADNLVGEQVPDFTLPNLDGKEVNFESFRDGNKAVVFFWATWCPHCRVALKEMNQDAAQLERQGIRLAVVNLGEKPAVVKKYVKQQKISLPMLLDIKTELATPFGLVGVPTFYFVNEEGIVVDIQHTMPEDLQATFNQQ